MKITRGKKVVPLQYSHPQPKRRIIHRLYEPWHLAVPLYSVRVEPSIRLYGIKGVTFDMSIHIMFRNDIKRPGRIYHVPHSNAISLSGDRKDKLCIYRARPRNDDWSTYCNRCGYYDDFSTPRSLVHSLRGRFACGSCKGDEDGLDIAHRSDDGAFDEWKRS